MRHLEVELIFSGAVITVFRESSNFGARLQRLQQLHIDQYNYYVLVFQVSNREVVQRLHSTVLKWGAEQIDIRDRDTFSLGFYLAVLEPS